MILPIRVLILREPDEVLRHLRVTLVTCSGFDVLTS